MERLPSDDGIIKKKKYTVTDCHRISQEEEVWLQKWGRGKIKDLRLQQHRVEIAVLKLSVSERNSTVVNTNPCGLQSRLGLKIQFKCLFGNDTNKEFKYRLHFFFSKNILCKLLFGPELRLQVLFTPADCTNNLKWWLNPNVLPLSLPESEWEYSYNYNMESVLQWIVGIYTSEVRWYLHPEQNLRVKCS